MATDSSPTARRAASWKEVFQYSEDSSLESGAVARVSRPRNSRRSPPSATTDSADAGHWVMLDARATQFECQSEAGAVRRVRRRGPRWRRLFHLRARPRARDARAPAAF